MSNTTIERMAATQAALQKKLNDLEIKFDKTLEEKFSLEDKMKSVQEQVQMLMEFSLILNKKNRILKEQLETMSSDDRRIWYIRNLEAVLMRCVMDEEFRKDLQIKIKGH